MVGFTGNTPNTDQTSRRANEKVTPHRRRLIVGDVTISGLKGGSQSWFDLRKRPYSPRLRRAPGVIK
jgi:hypothetical protein